MNLLLYILSVVVILRGYEIKGCLQIERVGLIKIKSYFWSINLDQTGVYSFPAWHVADNKSNCCHWEGVECNPYTGRVVQLSLSGKVFTYEPWDLNMTFFRCFEELNTLVLSWNNIGSLVGSEGLCRFKDLEELDFRGNYLSGALLHCLWNMTSLRDLDISDNQFSGKLQPYINIPSIEWLFVNQNHFQGKFLFSSLSNHSGLRGLILSDNIGLQVEIEESPPYPSNFQPHALGLGNCNLNTQAKAVWEFLSHQSNLQHIDLSDNSLFGSFPTWLLHNNSNLKHLTLSNNSFTGSLQLPEHSNLSLVYLDIALNGFSGKIPHHIGMTLSRIYCLDFSDNSFQGHIPSSLGNMTRLGALELSTNELSGELPWELFLYCTNLKFLDLSSNNLHGEIIPKFMNLPNLKFIDLKNNYFVGNMESLAKSTRLLNLDISDNMVTGELPSWIGSFEILEVLSLENNQFQGKIPIQICQLGSLVYMDLSSNRFVGEIPSCDINVISLKHLLMHGNNLTGDIPVGFASISQLVTIDLANNHISGVISPWIGGLSKLGTLILRGNHLQGELPTELCQLKGLNILDLSNNNFSGVLPSCLSGLSFGDTNFSDIYSSFVDVLKEGEKLFDGPFDFPMFVEVKTSDEADFIVKSRYTSYRGDILSIMSALDLSSNQLVGDIPPELGDLTMVNALNLSHNCLNGSIPGSFSKLKSIESLNLSSNKLSGPIPSNLVDLNFLEIFNVSYNHLSGGVPETGQFGAFDENNYQGNNYLCGSRFPKKCAIMEPPSTPLLEEGDEGETRFDLEVFLWSFAASFVTMLISTFLVLYINAGWHQVGLPSPICTCFG